MLLIQWKGESVVAIRINKKLPQNFKERVITLVNGDALINLKKLPNESIDLVLTSPPYNIGKDYEKRTSKDIYIAFQKQILKECYRVLKPTGSICWQVGNYTDNGSIEPLDLLLYDSFRELGFSLRNRIIWHFRHGLHAQRRFSGRYELIMWFTKTKSDDYTFNLDPVRIPSKYPGKKYYKGEKKGQPSGNPLGKNPSDLWEIEYIKEEWAHGIWDIPNVKAKHIEKTEHPCQFPVELAERCILALTNEGDTVLDPFLGVGSTLIASKKNNRIGIGFELDSGYSQTAKSRLSALEDGHLQIRPLGRPVYEPKNNEKVAQIPEEWLNSDKSIYKKEKSPI